MYCKCGMRVERERKRGHPRTYTDTAIVTMATLQESVSFGAAPDGRTDDIDWGAAAVGGSDSGLLDAESAAGDGGDDGAAQPVGRTRCTWWWTVRGWKSLAKGNGKCASTATPDRRTWRKIHVGVDEASGEIVAAVVTPNDYHDSHLLARLVGASRRGAHASVGRWAHMTGARGTRRLGSRQRAELQFRPQHNAKIWQHGNSKAERLARDASLRRIRQMGRAAWKRECGYHRRSLAERTVYRLKTIFSERVTARSFAGQAAQLLMRCATLESADAPGQAGQLRGVSQIGQRKSVRSFLIYAGTEAGGGRKYESGAVSAQRGAYAAKVSSCQFSVSSSPSPQPLTPNTHQKPKGVFSKPSRLPASSRQSRWNCGR